MPRKLICYGDLCTDILLQVRDVPLSGQDTIAEALNVAAGGSAANCAICASRLGFQTELLGVVGSDSFGEILVNDLSNNGVGVSHVRTVDGQSGVVIVLIDGSGERTMFSFRGANACVYGQLPSNVIRAGDCLYISGYSFQTDNSRATAMELLKVAEDTDVIRALDPSYVFARDARKLYMDVLLHVDFLFPNREEARLLSGSFDVEKSAAIIQSFGPRAVIITLGAEGCYVHSDEICSFVPVGPGTPFPVDTTGAGDAFCAGFLTGIMRGIDYVSAAHAGHKAAAEVIGVMGSHKRNG